MTQRSILAGKNQTIIIKAGGSATVKGHDSDLVTAETKGMWGLQVDKKSAAEFARARAAIGERVLFDLRFKKPGSGEQEKNEEIIEVQLGGSGQVLVPFSSNVKIYTGINIDVQGVRGIVDAYAGFKINMQNVDCLGNASAGGSMNLDCQTMLGTNIEFKAGGDIRFHIADLISANIRVKDLGGYWEGRIGAGEKSVYLKCGGDVTLVTDQKVEPLPPNYVLGKIETPSAA
jgi:hypothetical protein